MTFKPDSHPFTRLPLLMQHVFCARFQLKSTFSSMVFSATFEACCKLSGPFQTLQSRTYRSTVNIFNSKTNSYLKVTLTQCKNMSIFLRCDSTSQYTVAKVYSSYRCVTLTYTNEQFKKITHLQNQMQFDVQTAVSKHLNTSKPTAS